MHILLATDGSEQAIAAAGFIRTLANPAVLDRVTVMAVIRPITSAPFFGEVGVAGLTGKRGRASTRPPIRLPGTRSRRPWTRSRTLRRASRH